MRPRAAYEVPLLTATASRVIDMASTLVASGSSETPTTGERSPLDFDNKYPAPVVAEGTGAEEHAQQGVEHEIPHVETSMTTEVIQEVVLEEDMASLGPPANKRRKQMRRKRVNEEVEANAPPKVLRKDHVSSLTHSTCGGKSLATMGLDMGSTFSPLAETAEKSVSDPEPRSFAKPFAFPEQDMAQSSKGVATEIHTEHVANTEACQDMMDHTVPPGYFSELRHLPNDEFLRQYNMNLTRQVAMGSQLRLRFEQEDKLLKKATTEIAKRDQRIQTREEEIKKLDEEIKSLGVVETKVHGLRTRTQNLETLLEAEIDMKKAAEAKNADLASELESLHAKFSDLQVNNQQLSQQVSTLQAQVTGEE
ncbi:hypothetical protein Tco_0935985 [Tanacetum coccineum]